MLTFIFCALFACQDADKEGFSTSGSGINPNESGPTGSGDDNSNNDPGTGDGVSTGNLEDADNEDAPQISGVDAFFSDYEGIGDLIEVHVYYTDIQDDIEGGLMQLSYSNAETMNSTFRTFWVCYLSTLAINLGEKLILSEHQRCNQ